MEKVNMNKQELKAKFDIAYECAMKEMDWKNNPIFDVDDIYDYYDALQEYCEENDLVDEWLIEYDGEYYFNSQKFPKEMMKAKLHGGTGAIASMMVQKMVFWGEEVT
jgi:hypothetical protein